MIPHIFNGNGTISIMIDGKMKPVDTAHKFYEDIKDALREQNWDIIPSLVNIKEQVEKAINASTVKGQVTVADGVVKYNGTVVHNTLTARIIDMARDGFDIGHMVKFLENLMDNPSFRAVNELYDFLEAGAIPITENGTFLTYKKIQGNWTDIHSGKFDNSIGTKVEMPRNMVNEDSSQTCSAGLHVCSYDYLSNFGWSDDNRVVICEVNPADVVSIPADYNNTKMRVCAYTVIGEVEDYTSNDELSKNSVVYTADVRFVDAEPKQIGKELESLLENDYINNDQIASICEDAGLNYRDAEDMEDIAESGDYRRLGKKVAKMIKSGAMDGTKFVAAMESAEEAVDNEDLDENVCERCSSPLNGSEECSECGYWQS